MSGTNQTISEPIAKMVSKRDLFQNVMKNDWNKILAICKEQPEAHKEKITRTGDTLLHLAVADGKNEIVQQLVELIKKLGNDATRKALGIVNERKNTPLHLAASQGNVQMCQWIAREYPEGIGARNVDGETPFFLAATYGMLDAFLCLHFISQENENNGLYYARRNSGETVLHTAIHGDYFGTFVEELKQETTGHAHLRERLKNSIKDEISSSQRNYPENYDTCVSFFRRLYKIFLVLVSVDRKENDEKNNKQFDAEKGQQGDDMSKVSADRKENDQKNKRPKDAKKGQCVNPSVENKSTSGAQGHELFPPNYGTFFEAVKLIYKTMLIILGLGSRRIVKMREKKEKHMRAVQIMNELIKNTRIYEYEDSGGNPRELTEVKEDETTPYTLGEGGFDDIMGPSDIWTEDVPFPQQIDQDHSDSESNQNGDGDQINKDMNKQGIEEPIKERTVETPLLIAARHGVKEMVEKILEQYPVAIYDTNTDKKNILLVAVEYRQPHVYQFLLERKTMKDPVFSKIDKDGNSALHLAACLNNNIPWLIPGAALQMQWEFKWYEFVKNSAPPHFFARYNNKGETPKDVFTRTHSKLVIDGGKWLTKTSESCSVVAALIATVAFATSTTVPGGIDEKKGTPKLENEPAFDVFAISSVVALCVSVTALIMFLAILTSRYQEKDFSKELPRKLLTGLSSLFISIASMLISFCAGHFFVLKDKLKYGVYPIYAVTCLPITFFAMAQFPLYFDLIRATFKKVPQRRFKVVPPEELKDVTNDHPERKLIEDSKALIVEARANLKQISREVNRGVNILAKMGGDPRARSMRRSMIAD
ncbi:hypothetical protein LguiB_000282 [Lonicera macranthoides]